MEDGQPKRRPPDCISQCYAVPASNLCFESVTGPPVSHGWCLLARGGHTRVAAFVLLSTLALGGVERAEAQTNMPPEAANDHLVTDEDRSFSADVTGNVITGAGLTMPGVDRDPDSGVAPTVVRYAAGTSLGSSPTAVGTALVVSDVGTLTIESSGAFRFRADKDLQSLMLGTSHTERFTYEITDGALSDEAMLRIVIEGRNDAPGTMDDVGMVNQKGPNLNVAAPGLLANDTDVDEGDIRFLVGYVTGNSYQVRNAILQGSDAMGMYGTLRAVANGSYVYVPGGAATEELAAGQKVTDVFTYRMRDGHGATADGRLEVTVTGVVKKLTVINFGQNRRIGVEEGAEVVYPMSQASISQTQSCDERGDGEARPPCMNNRWRTHRWMEIQGLENQQPLPEEWFPAGTSVEERRPNRVIFRENGRVTLGLGDINAPSRAGFLDALGLNLVIKYETADGEGSLVLEGIGLGMSSRDTTEPYAWAPRNQADVTALARALGRADIQVCSLVANCLDVSGTNWVSSIEFNDTRRGETYVPSPTSYDVSQRLSVSDQIIEQVNGSTRWRTTVGDRLVGPRLPDAWFTRESRRNPTTRRVARVLLEEDGHVELRMGAVGDPPRQPQSVGIVFQNPDQISMVLTLQTGNRIGTLAFRGIRDDANDGEPFRWRPVSAQDAADVRDAVALLALQPISADHRVLEIRFNDAGRGETILPLATPPPPTPDIMTRELGTNAMGDEVSDSEASGELVIAHGMVDARVEGRAGTSGTWMMGSDTANTGDGTRLSGVYGDLFLRADSIWTYELDDTRDVTDALGLNTKVADVFTFRAVDGTTISSVLRVGIEVMGSNDPPMANPDINVAAASGASLNISAANGLLSNDTDVDTGDTAAVVGYSASETGTYPGSGATPAGNDETGMYGILRVEASGAYTYTLSGAAVNALVEGATVMDVFAYRMQDGAGMTSDSKLTITVTGANDPPTLVVDPEVAADTETIEKGIDSSGNDVAGDPAGNGKLTASDTDTGTTTTLEGRAGTTGTSWTAGDGTAIVGTYGDVTLMADGNWTYALVNDRMATNALADGADATDTFTFRASDGTVFSQIVQIDIAVAGTNDAPVAGVIPDQPATEGTRFAYPVPAGTLADPDTGDETLAYSASLSDDTALPAWLGFDVSTQAFDGIPPIGSAPPSLSIKVTASDGKGGVASSTFTMTIEDTNRMPVAVDDRVVTHEKAVTATGNVIDGDPNNANAGADSDPDPGQTPVVTRYAAGTGLGSTPTDAPGSVMGAHGSLTIAVDGTLTYTIADSNHALVMGGSNMDVFTYEVTDGFLQDTATLTIVIEGRNDVPTVVGEPGADTETIESGVDGSGNDVAGDPAGSGKLTADDADAGTTPTFEGRAGTTGASWTASGGAAIIGTYGDVTLMADGNWTYALANARMATNALADGADVTDTFTFRVSDGTIFSQIVRIDIAVAGTNDKPVGGRDSGPARNRGQSVRLPRASGHVSRPRHRR